MSSSVLVQRAPRTEPLRRTQGMSKDYSGAAANGLSRKMSDGGCGAGDGRGTKEDNFDFYDIPSQSSQDTPGRGISSRTGNRGSGGASASSSFGDDQQYLRGEPGPSPSVSLGTRAQDSSTTPRRPRPDLGGHHSSRAAGGDSSERSSAAGAPLPAAVGVEAAKHVGIGESRLSGGGGGSQGPGLTAISEPLLRMIELAAKTASRGAYFAQLQASAPHLSPQQLASALQDLQLGGFIYQTGSGAYTTF